MELLRNAKLELLGIDVWLTPRVILMYWSWSLSTGWLSGYTGHSGYTDYSSYTNYSDSTGNSDYIVLPNVPAHVSCGGGVVYLQYG